MNLALHTRGLRVSIPVLGLLSASAALPLSLAASGRIKPLAVILGGAVALTAAFISGNPRLFCLWGLMLTIPFDLSKRFGTVIYKMGGENSFRVEMSDPFLLALVLFLARDIWAGSLRGVRVPEVTFIWFLIMLLGCIAIVLGPWRTTAAHEVVRMLKVTVLFLVICNELRSPGRVLQCATGLSLGVMLQSIVALIQYVTRSHFGLDLLGETGPRTIEILADSTVHGEKVFRVGAFLSHPNIFGAYLATLLPLAIGAFLLQRGRIHKLFFLSCASLGMAALIATLSRSGWVSFAAGFTMLLSLMILHRGLRRRSMMAAAFATVALLTVSAMFMGPITKRVFQSKPDATLGRAEYVRDARGMFAARPLMGWGLNSYVFAAPPFTQYGPRGAALHYKNWLPPVHNVYYLWLAETGIIGLAIHLILLAAIIWRGVRNLRVTDELMFVINAACLSGMVALVVDGFFSFSLRINSVLRVFWVLAGIIMAVHYWRLRHEGSGRAPRQSPATA